jgi:hypothetical protein
MNVGHARATWTAAGFTGTFSPESGVNNETVLTQSQDPGDCLPASASIVVTHT